MALVTALNVICGIRFLKVEKMGQGSSGAFGGLVLSLEGKPCIEKEHSILNSDNSRQVTKLPKCFVKHGLCICCLCILFYEGETSFHAINWSRDRLSGLKPTVYIINNSSIHTLCLYQVVLQIKCSDTC